MEGEKQLLGIVLWLLRARRALLRVLCAYSVRVKRCSDELAHFKCPVYCCSAWGKAFGRERKVCDVISGVCSLCRVLLDRAHSDYDSMFHHLDLDMLSSPQPSPVNQFANTSETNTSDRPSSKDLSQILVDIKSCRWRHFRPRTPSLPDSDSGELSSRKLHRSISRAGPAQPGAHTCSASTQSRSSSGSTHCGMSFCGTHCYKGGVSHLVEDVVYYSRSEVLTYFFEFCSVVLLLCGFVCTCIFP